MVNQSRLVCKYGNFTTSNNDGVSQTSTRFGLIVSKPKTEVQCVGKGRQQLKILLEEQVENFVYLEVLFQQISRVTRTLNEELVLQPAL